MKAFFSVVLFLLFSLRLFSQDLTKETLAGKWIVVDSKILTDMKLGLNAESEKMMEQMRIGFIGAIFKFEMNNNFRINFPNNTTIYMKELEFLNNKLWKIQEGQSIKIGTVKDGYSLMRIVIKTIQGKKYFVLDESPFILEVKQQN